MSLYEGAVPAGGLYALIQGAGMTGALGAIHAGTVSKYPKFSMRFWIAPRRLALSTTHFESKIWD